ncbi:MAG: glycosyltransferase family 4 protein [Anaerolineae bacterium]|nr:glycosyltransferase family 4 protein [Anaerolineae bacterium]
MRIGIDASRAISPHPTGTETYSRRLIQALLNIDTRHSYRLYLRTPLSPNQNDELVPQHSRVDARLRAIPFPRLWTHLRLSWEMLRFPPDLLFVPAHVLPLVHPPLSLVTIHDLGYLHFPDAHPPWQRRQLDLTTRWNARAAAHLLADSEATRADLIRHYGAPAARITVTYPGYDESLAPVRDPATIAAVKARYGIRDDYFLYLGTLQPRKNLARLVDAFAQLPHVPTLVIAGKRGWLYDDLFNQVGRLGLKERVIFTGYIPEQDKAPLLSGALAFVFPSLYEGFGLPVLEAQACGCPVICSATSSLPEVAGKGAMLVDPSDAEALSAAMAHLVADPAGREKLVQRGFANLPRFSWQQCAQTVLAVIDRLAPPEAA